MNQPAQDRGLAHCHYIRLLTNEIWCRENDKSAGKHMSWNDCLKLALELHVNKLKALSGKPKEVKTALELVNRRMGW